MLKKEGSEYFLQTRQSYGGEFLKFVHLTRDRMEANPPDILLTNPDTINYRLFNINDEKAHRLFVDQPKFLVFDEVHTYEGLFGAHVSSLVKRLRRLRKARDVDDPLRLVASSATVGHKEELFQRLFGVPHGDPYEIIEEDTIVEAPSPVGSLPKYVTSEIVDAASLRADLERWYAGEPVQTYSWLDDLGIKPNDCRGTDAVLRTAADAGSIPWLTHLHEVLRDPTEIDDIANAPRPADFVDYIATTYGVDAETAETAAQNVLSLFEAGDFEIRVHVFNWPVDGYYKCLHCHSIYPSPQSCDCDESAGHSSFVTKIRLCNKCGEQLYEAWYCPDCADVRPLRQETEGEYLYANEPECSHENHGDLTRVYFTPEYECESCERTATPSESLGSCDACGGLLTRTEDGIACKNPECSNEGRTVDTACNNCGGRLAPRTTFPSSVTTPSVISTDRNSRGQSVAHVTRRSSRVLCSHGCVPTKTTVDITHRRGSRVVVRAAGTRSSYPRTSTRRRQTTVRSVTRTETTCTISPDPDVRYTVTMMSSASTSRSIYARRTVIRMVTFGSKRRQ